MFANTFFITPGDGEGYVIKTYVAATMGGWGSLRGAVAGAIIVATFGGIDSFNTGAVALVDGQRCHHLAPCFLRPPPASVSISPPRHSFLSPAGTVRRSRSAARVMFKPERIRPAVAAVALCALVAWPLVMSSPYELRLFTLAGVFAILVIGYQFIFGYVGELSLSQGRVLWLLCATSRASLPRRPASASPRHLCCRLPAAFCSAAPDSRSWSCASRRIILRLQPWGIGQVPPAVGDRLAIPDRRCDRPFRCSSPKTFWRSDRTRLAASPIRLDVRAFSGRGSLPNQARSLWSCLSYGQAERCCGACTGYRSRRAPLCDVSSECRNGRVPQARFMLTPSGLFLPRVSISRS